MDAYKIGVEIALGGNISAALGALGKQFLGLHGDAEKVGQSIAKWGTAIQGVASLAAGGAILGTMKSLAEHGMELVHVQQQLAMTGVTAAEASQAQAKAWEVSTRYGLKVTQVLGDIKEAQSVFGSTEHAIEFIDPLEKMRVVLNSVTEGSGDKVKEAVYAMARAGELKGLTSPEDFLRYFDGMTKAISASGGKVDPNAFMQATKYGKIATKGWNEEFYTKILPSMIQEFGPSTAGTALMSLSGTLGQGKVSIRAMKAIDDLGLIGDSSKLRNDKLGNAVGFDPGAIVNTKLFTENPYEWAQKELRPRLEKQLGHAIKAGDTEVLNILSGMFGNRNSAAAIATLLLENNRIDKEAKLQGRAVGLDGADKMLANDSTAVMNNFHNAWDNLLTSLGSPLVAPALTGLNAIAAVINKFTLMFAAHPDIIHGVGIAATGVGVSLLATGASKIGKSIFGNGALTGSAMALNGSAAALTEAAVALGGGGVVGKLGGAAAGVGGGLLRTIGKGLGLAAVGKIGYDVYDNWNKTAEEKNAEFKALQNSSWNQPFGNRDWGSPSGPHHQAPSNIHVNPLINVSLDGKAIAAYVTGIVTKMMPHPTGAPMAGGDHSPYSFDGSAAVAG